MRALADFDARALARTSPRFPDVAILAESHQQLLGCGLDAVIIRPRPHSRRDHHRLPPGRCRRRSPRSRWRSASKGATACWRWPARRDPAVCRPQHETHAGGHHHERPHRRGAVGEVQTIWCRHFVGDGGDYYFKDWHADRPRRPACCCRRVPTTWTSSTGSPAATPAASRLWVRCRSTATSPTAATAMARDGRLADRDNWPPAEPTRPPPGDRRRGRVDDAHGPGQRRPRSYQQCHFTPDYWRNYTVIGTEGGWRTSATRPVPRSGVVRRSGYRAEADRSVDVTEIPGTHGGADELLMAGFLAFVRDGSPTLRPPPVGCSWRPSPAEMGSDHVVAWTGAVPWW